MRIRVAGLEVNTGIGKAYLTAGDYVQAMKYLKLGMNRDYYSIAYRRYHTLDLDEISKRLRKEGL